MTSYPVPCREQGNASSDCSERYLIAAVLEQAIQDCKPVRPRVCTKPPSPHRAWFRRDHKRKLKLNRAHAMDWIFHEPDPDCSRPFSFDWCCFMVGYSADYLRKRIRATIAGKLSERHLWITLGGKWGDVTRRAS